MKHTTRIDDIISIHIDNGSIPGAVILLSRRGRLLYNKAFGKADSDRPLQTVNAVIE